MGMGMMKQYAAEAVRGRAGRNYNSDLLFSKTGKEIKESIEGTMKARFTKIEELKAKVADICKKRELDPKEVIEAGTDEIAVQTYSLKAETSMGPSRANNLIRELQEDLQALRINASIIESENHEIASLQRVQKNIELDRKFDLTYNDLVEFGF